MKEFRKNLVERFVGKQFRTITDVICENYQTTNDVSIIEAVFDELFEGVAFETYIEFLNEEISLPVIQPSPAQPETKRYSFATMKEDMKNAGGAWRDKTAHKTARKALGIGPSYRLFTQEAGNPKLAKSIQGRETLGLTLLPEKQSGIINTCPCATESCAKACLNMTGRGAMSQEARKKKLEKVVTQGHDAAVVIHNELDAHERAMTRRGMKAVARLNVVSDVPWETVHPDFFTQHKNVQFYDYTKIASRVLNADGTPRQLPENYHLTLSSTGISGKDTNWHHVRQHLNNGGVSAMVFAVPAGRGDNPGGVLPSHVIDEHTGKKYRVIDADAHDHRYLDHLLSDIPKGEGVIAGLRTKGGKENMKRAGHFAVQPTDDKGSPVVVPASHPANQTK